MPDFGVLPMRWANFLYLLPALFAAVVLLAVTIRLTPRLSRPSSSRTKEELLLLATLSLFGLVVIYWNFYISKTYFVYNVGDVGSDTTEQYYPFYLWLIDSVRNGTLASWTFDYELGVSIQTFQTWLFDPFNLIVVPLGLLLGNAKLSVALTISQSIKVLLSAFLFDHLLTRYCETPLARLLGSLLYSFSGFMILYGQHYWIGGIFPLFTATILAFELYQEAPSVRSFLLAVAIVALQLTWSAYVSFMILLATAIYLLLRIPVRTSSFVGFLKTVALMFLPVICGFLLSCVSCIPYATFLMGETARTANASPLTERLLTKLGMFVHLDWIPAIFSRMVGSGLINTGAITSTPTVSSTSDIGFVGSFPYEFILLGYSGGVFMLLSQFYHWVIAECKRKEQLLVLAASAVVAFYCFNEFLPSVFTMMVRTQYRSCFALALPFCIAMTIGFEYGIVKGHLAKAPFVATALLTLVVIVWSLANTLNGRLVCLYYLAATLACVILALYANRLNIDKAASMAILVAAMFSMSVVDGLFTTNCRMHVEPWGLPYTPESGEETFSDEALRYLKENDDTFYRVDKDFSNWCPLNDSLIQHYASVSAYNSSPDADVDAFYHKLWKEAISTWAVYSQGFRNDPGHPELMSLLDVKYVMTLQQRNDDWLEPVTQIGDVYVYKNLANPSLLTLRSNTVSETEADLLPDSAARRSLLAQAVIVPDSIAASWTSTGAQQEESQPATFWKDDQTHLHGVVEASAPSVACLSIPYTGTWDILVDGKAVETFRANYGFYGFVLDAGSHTIEASYHFDGFGLGLTLTCVGAALTLLCCFGLHRYARSERLAGEGANHASAA